MSIHNLKTIRQKFKDRGVFYTPPELAALQGVIYADDAQAVAQGSIVGEAVGGGLNLADHLCERLTRKESLQAFQTVIEWNHKATKEMMQ